MEEEKEARKPKQEGPTNEGEKKRLKRRKCDKRGRRATTPWQLPRQKWQLPLLLPLHHLSPSSLLFFSTSSHPIPIYNGQLQNIYSSPSTSFKEHPMYPTSLKSWSTTPSETHVFFCFFFFFLHSFFDSRFHAPHFSPQHRIAREDKNKRPSRFHPPYSLP